MINGSDGSLYALNKFNAVNFFFLNYINDEQVPFFSFSWFIYRQIKDGVLTLAGANNFGIFLDFS